MEGAAVRDELQLRLMEELPERGPVELTRRDRELDTATWRAAFEEAAALGALHVHLSGGEPAARADLVELVARASRAGLYTTLVTSGVGLADDRLLLRHYTRSGGFRGTRVV